MSVYTDLFDSIKNDVITLTNRPDLDAETMMAVRTATLSTHMTDAYPRDSVAQIVKNVTPSYLASLDSTILFPRIRGLSTVRITDVEDSPMDFPEVEVVEMGDVRDPIYHTIRNDIAYMAGTAINIRTSIQAVGYLIEYFQLPLVARAQYNSWIAQLSPDVIVYHAASIVLSTNGSEEKAKAYMSLYEKTLLPQLKSSFLTSAQR